jgi:3-oxoacyl-[acyl-carrier protein] reductase
MSDSPRCEYIEIDIVRRENISRSVVQTFEKYGRMDVLVDNAGVSTFEPFEEHRRKSLTG